MSDTAFIERRRGNVPVERPKPFVVDIGLHRVLFREDEIHRVLPTNLPGRTFFENVLINRIQAEARRMGESTEARMQFEETPVAISFCDLCGLKNVNDTYGHDAGDAYLHHFAKVVAVSIHESDIFIHQSGDEFVLTFFGKAACEEYLSRIFSRVLQAMQASPLHYERREGSVSSNLSIPLAGVSIGACTSKLHDIVKDGVEGLRRIVKAADAIMSEVKLVQRSGFAIMSIDHYYNSSASSLTGRIISPSIRRQFQEAMNATMSYIEAMDGYAKRHSAHSRHLFDSFMNWVSNAHAKPIFAAACPKLMLRMASRVWQDFYSDLAAYHDIGKARMPRHILTNANPLTKEDMGIIHLHPEKAIDILATPMRNTYPIDDIPDADFNEELRAMSMHHERTDSRGYPEHIGGSFSRIPEFARLLAVIDSASAMAFRRPHAEPKEPNDIARELLLQVGKAYDPRILYPFILYYADQSGNIDRDIVSTALERCDSLWPKQEDRD